jgi:exonuclease III
LEANKNETYCERNNFMCITFELLDGKKITLINFYNKKNDGKYPMLDVENNLFEIEDNIKEVLNGNNNLIVFAGDFNTGSNNTDLEHRQRYTKLCNKLSEFTDISKGNPEYNQNTSLWYHPNTKKGYFMRNDFCFVNKLDYIKKYTPYIPSEDEWVGEENAKRWNELSDHCPIIIDLKL